MSVPADESGGFATQAPARVHNGYQRLVITISCICALAILATAGGLAWHLRHAAIARADAEIGKLAHVMAEETARQFQTIDLALVAVEKELAGAATMTQAFAENARTDASIDTLRRQIAAIPQLNSMFVIGADGVVLAGTRQGRELRTDLHDRDYFVALRDDPGLERFISGPVPNRVDGTWSIYAARRLAAPDGTFLGVVAAAFRLDYFEDLYQAIYLGPGSSIGLNRGDGMLLARYPPFPDRIGRSFPGARRMVDTVTDRESTVVHVMGEVTPVPLALAGRRVPGYPLIATVTVTEPAALADWYPQAIAIAVLAALALLAVASIAWLLLRQLASRSFLDRETGARRELERSMALAHRAIFEARESEARLRRSEEHLIRAQELGSLGSFERYFEPEQLAWSPEIYRIFGVDPHSFQATSVNHLAMVHAEDRDRVVASQRRAMQGNDNPPMEYRIVRPDGAIRLVRRTLAPIRGEAGTIVGMFGVLQDITDQRQSEVRLQLLQSVSLAIAEAADFDSALTTVLRAVCDSTEWAYGEAWLAQGDETVLARGPVWHIERPELAQYAEERRTLRLGKRDGHIERAWSTRQPVWVPELAASPAARPLLVKRAQGAGIVSAFAVPICAGNEVLAVARFATLVRRERDDGLVEIIAAVAAQLGTALERKRIEQALRASEQQLRQAQKMEAVGNLTGGIAHDFNNLLGAIIGNLDLLQLSLDPDSENAEIAREAQQAALLGAELTRSLLAFARRQPLRPRPTDLNDLIGGLSKLLRRILGEHIDFKLDLGAEVLPILVDPAQLESALTNLATNARDAMPQGGDLTIRTRNFTVGEDYIGRNPDATPGSYAEIEVSDTGIGMTPTIISRIFEPFFTTKAEGKGSGLGLSMVFGFVKQSGGHVSVDSCAGEGTVVRLFLPHADGAPAETAAPAAREIACGGETILVIEDNEKMRDVVVRQLTGLGYRVRSAENAAAALEFLRHEPAVDLLFTDIVMPGGMNGVELARTVAARYPQVRTLLTSGFSEARIGGGEPGQLQPRLLGKPYRLRELARTIREVLDEPQPAMMAADA